MEAALSPEEYRAVWDAKPVLRAVYRDYYERLAAWCRPGVILEVGAGSGNLKDELPVPRDRSTLVASDIVASPLVDVALDAQAMPLADGSIGTVAGVDVLHHIEYPRLFLQEVRRVLAPGGRLVLIEPAITPLSRVVFKLGHPEPIILGVDPLATGVPDRGKHPFDANQALPTLLAGPHRHRLEPELGLRLVHEERLSLLAYPLSGGFRPWSLLPRAAVGPVLRAEARLAPRLGRWLGFRLMLVLERCEAPPTSP